LTFLQATNLTTYLGCQCFGLNHPIKLSFET